MNILQSSGRFKTLIVGTFMGLAMGGVAMMAQAPPCASADATCPVGSTSLFSGNIGVQGGTAYTATFNLASTTADRLITFPDKSTVLVGRDTTDTLSNKTLTAPILSSMTDITLTANTGNYTIDYENPTADRTVTIPDADPADSSPKASEFLLDNSTQTITNKTFTNAQFEGSFKLKNSTANFTVTWADPPSAHSLFIPYVGSGSHFIVGTASAIDPNILTSNLTTFNDPITTGVWDAQAVTSSGIITADSSNSTKYVRIYGGSGTGQWDIYGSGANLRFTDNTGTGLVDIDTDLTVDGNVGVGGTPTTLSTSNLYVEGTTTAEVHILTTSATSFPILRFKGKDSLSAVGHWAISVRGNDENKLRLFNEDTSKGILIESDGTVDLTDGTLKTTGPIRGNSLLAGDNTTGNAYIVERSGDQPTAGSTSYTWYGNTGTGIRRVASGVIALDTDSVERVRIQSTGVGIGDVTPTSLLHLKGTAPDITYEDTVGDKFIVGNNSGEFRIRNATDTRTDVTVDGAGEVGIGTTSPDALLEIEQGLTASGTIVQLKCTVLDCYPNLRFQNDATTWRVYGADGSQGDVFGIWNTYTRLAITTGGNVGIGLGHVAPSSILHIEDSQPTFQIQDSNASGRYSLARIHGMDDTDAITWDVGKWTTGASEYGVRLNNRMTNGWIAFLTENTERARIDSTGKFRIMNGGTEVWNSAFKVALVGGHTALANYDNVTTYLMSNAYYDVSTGWNHLLGSSAWSLMNIMNVTDGTTRWYTSSTAGTGGFVNTQRLMIDNNGDLHIGTGTYVKITPSGSFVANGSPLSLSRTGAGSMQINNDITFAPYNTTDAMIIEQTTGHVGIGTASPTSHLGIGADRSVWRSIQFLDNDNSGAIQAYIASYNTNTIDGILRLNAIDELQLRVGDVDAVLIGVSTEKNVRLPNGSLIVGEDISATCWLCAKEDGSGGKNLLKLQHDAGNEAWITMTTDSATAYWGWGDTGGAGDLYIRPHNSTAKAMILDDQGVLELNMTQYANCATCAPILVLDHDPANNNGWTNIRFDVTDFAPANNDWYISAFGYNGGGNVFPRIGFALDDGYVKWAVDADGDVIYTDTGASTQFMTFTPESGDVIIMPAKFVQPNSSYDPYFAEVYYEITCAGSYGDPACDFELIFTRSANAVTIAVDIERTGTYPNDVWSHWRCRVATSSGGGSIYNQFCSNNYASVANPLFTTTGGTGDVILHCDECLAASGQNFGVIRIMTHRGAGSLPSDMEIKVYAD